MGSLGRKGGGRVLPATGAGHVLADAPISDGTTHAATLVPATGHAIPAAATISLSATSVSIAVLLSPDPAMVVVMGVGVAAGAGLSRKLGIGCASAANTISPPGVSVLSAARQIDLPQLRFKEITIVGVIT